MYSRCIRTYSYVYFTNRSAVKIAQSCQIIDLSKLMSEEDMEMRWFLLSHEAQLLLIKSARRLSRGSAVSQVLCEDRLAIRSYEKKSDFDEETEATPETAQVGSLSGKVDHYACQPRKNPSQGKAHWLKSNLLSPTKVVLTDATPAATGRERS